MDHHSQKQPQQRKRLAIHARVDAPLVQGLDNWRRKQFQIPARSVAVCELLRLALQAEERRLAKEHTA
jgi:hypothetical protein